MQSWYKAGIPSNSSVAVGSAVCSLDEAMTVLAWLNLHSLLRGWWGRELGDLQLRGPS